MPFSGPAAPYIRLFDFLGLAQAPARSHSTLGPSPAPQPLQYSALPCSDGRWFGCHDHPLEAPHLNTHLLSAVQGAPQYTAIRAGPRAGQQWWVVNTAVTAEVPGACMPMQTTLLSGSPKQPSGAPHKPSSHPTCISTSSRLCREPSASYTTAISASYRLSKNRRSCHVCWDMLWRRMTRE